jgi:alanine-synthesizing transaminase
VFSKRARWDAAVNELTLARGNRTGLLDLTETNPTRAGLAYPLDALADAMGRGARGPYDADPRGIRSAREALAAHLHCHPDDLLLTASTSEAYAFLFKLLTDPGDSLLTATPSYPLLDHLAQMEHVTLRTFSMEFHRRWEIHDVPVDAGTRAILVVNPNNPTGSFVSETEQERLARLRLPIISDEVFLDYPLEGRGSTFVRNDVLSFTLGGLSKSAGLPHFKLGWIRVSGPEKTEALHALEMIADNYLSVAAPVQRALPELLTLGATIREAISERTQRNLAVLRTMNCGSIETLPVEGGWSAVLRVPRTRTDDELALRLLDAGVIVQPGYFFDFEREGFLIVSLLTAEDVFREGMRRIVEVLEER